MLPDFRDPNLQWVLFGSTLLGIAAAVLGCFALLRGRSLMGDALAHAALPGVCCAFLFGEAMRSRGWLNLESKNLALLLVGASLSGLLGAWCIAAIARHSRIKEDAAQAIVLSVFFGAGVVLLSFIQQGESGQQSGLDKFLWGSAASLVLSDVRAMSFVAAILCLMSWMFYKEFKLLCFDPDFGNGLGLPMNRLDGLLLLMIVGAVVIGLQAVGVVLISALLIMPPAAARFWTEKLHIMTPVAALLGGLSGALGAVFSALDDGLPTGPLIVLAATAMFLVSLLFAPQRGVFARLLRHLSTRRLVRRENLLRDLYEIAEERVDDEATIQENEFLQMRRTSPGSLSAGLRELQNEKLIVPIQTGWRFTEQGLEEGYRMVRRHRLWETFLMYETSLGAQSVDRDADAVEHFLPPEAIAQLEELMRRQGREPKLMSNGS
jgi:manganese/zinc/iron transport system permease protein